MKPHSRMNLSLLLRRQGVCAIVFVVSAKIAPSLLPPYIHVGMDTRAVLQMHLDIHVG